MRYNTLGEWLAWQESLHVRAIDLGLERIRPVFQNLIKGSLAANCIVVGGTNGKGSTVAFLEAMYLAAGYRVGSYTSPHLFAYNERIKLDGKPVSDAQLCEAFERVDQCRGEVSLTYFEFGTLAAFDIFQRAGLDVAILEVGLGGRLDAVNLVDADVAIVTNVSLDHMDWLGETREQIAHEKFGIARPGRPLIFADEQQLANLDTLAQAIDLYRIGRDFGFEMQRASWQWWSREKNLYSLPLPKLPGRHQLKNATTALMVIHLLSDRLPVAMSNLRDGLRNAELAGRFQVLVDAEKLLIFDVAHNPDGIRVFVEQLNRLPRLGEHHLVLGMLADKDIETLAAMLRDVVDKWYLAGLDVPRGLGAEQLQRALQPAFTGAEHVHCFESVA